MIVYPVQRCFITPLMTKEHFSKKKLTNPELCSWGLLNFDRNGDGYSIKNQKAANLMVDFS